MTSTQGRLRRRAVMGAIAAGMLATGVALTGPGVGEASSHREAPLIAGEPRLDNTDVYAFVSPDKPGSVTLIANWIPFEEPNGGPNFYAFADGAAYDINIDNDGDARPDITYRWTFRSTYQNKNTFLYNTGVVTSLTDPDLNFRQTYRLQRIAYKGGKVTNRTTLISNGKVAPSFTGPASMPDYGPLADSAITGLPGGAKSFAGQADDPFFADLRVFDLLYGADFSEVGQDTLRGYNVNTVAFQVPAKELALKSNVTRNPVIGVWSTTSRAGADVSDRHGSHHGDGLRQVSRLGMPLVNEVVIPVGRKNEFNASRPVDDKKFLPFITNPEVPKLVQAIYHIPAPATPRKDLVEVFLTGLCATCGPVAVDLNSQQLNQDAAKKAFRPSEQLRLNMSVPPTANPKRLGVIAGDLAGFPNGRRLADDVLDVTLQVAEGVLLPGHPAVVDTLGDQVDTNAVPFRTAFPYLALPNMISVNQQ